MGNRGGKRVKFDEAKENSNINIQELFNIPFSLLVSREWDLNYLLISSSDRDKIGGFGYPVERGGILVYDLKTSKAREIMRYNSLITDKETDFYVAYSNVSNVRDYFKAKRVFLMLEKIENPDHEEKFKKGIARDVIKGVEAQISTKRKVQ